jgi:pilus assembly protein Flp/PilA
MTNDFRALIGDDQGQGLAEYGMILGLIAVICYAAVALLGTNISTVLHNVATDI